MSMILMHEIVVVDTGFKFPLWWLSGFASPKVAGLKLAMAAAFLWRQNEKNVCAVRCQHLLKNPRYSKII